MAEISLTPLKQISLFMNKDSVKSRFEKILGNKAPQFISSCMTAVNSNKLLQNATPESVYGAAMMAAAVDLPINQNLGFAYFVPYSGQCQFQIGYKGFVQLAMRSGQYLKINVVDIKEGQLEVVNPITEEYKFNTPKSDKVVGYMAYFKLVNGFEKYLYMSVEEIKKHSLAYSKTARSSNGLWSTNFDAMACKTVLKRLLSKFGVLSIEMTKAQTYDQAVVNKSADDVEDITPEEIVYADNEPEQPTAEEAAKVNENVSKMDEFMKK